MIVVSGCPRSGTSLMMEIMRVLFGEENVVGKKFPHEMPGLEVSDPNEPPDRTREYMSYIRTKRVDNRRGHAEDMNPDGFWECPCTVRGLFYHPSIHNLLENHGPNKVIKVVSSGLANSDPHYIDKVVYMVRHPDNVAKSQEKLIRPGFNDNGGPVGPDGEEVKIFSYQMFNNTTVAAAYWIDRFDPEIMVVNFDDLIDNTQNMIEAVAGFVLPEFGELDEACACVKPSLRRSIDIPEHDEKLGQEYAYALYDRVKVGDFAGVKDVVEDFRERMKVEHQDKGRLFCSRLQRSASREECNLCRTHEVTRNNFKRAADRRSIDWLNEPCAYDCVVEGFSIENSVANNHWM